MNQFVRAAAACFQVTVWLGLIGLSWLVPAASAARRLFADPVQIIEQATSPLHILPHTFPGGVQRLLVTNDHRQVQILDPQGADPWQPLAVVEMVDPYLGNSSPGSGLRLLLADVNEDAIDDMILDGSTIFVAPGRSDGSYAPPFAWNMGHDREPLFVQDVNGDGHVDLVRPSSGSDLITFRAGRGDGRFNPIEQGLTGEYEDFLLAADMTGDGLIDLLRSGGDTLALIRYVADGAGGFQRTPTSPLLTRLDEVLGLGLMDNDDEPDLISIDYAYSFPDYSGTFRLSIHSGLGDGHFAEPVSSWMVDGESDLSLFDIDRDGHDDVISHHDGFLSMYRSRGDGTLESRSDIVNSTGSGTPYFHDFDGDGQTDILVTAFESLRLATGADMRKFPVPPSIVFPSRNSQSHLADMDGDGRLDLVGIEYRRDVSVVVRPGQVGGSFGSPRLTQLLQLFWTPGLLDPADLDGDGDVDLLGIIHNRGGSDGVVFENDGSGGLVAGPIQALGFELSSLPMVDDLDGDGIAEFLHTDHIYHFRDPDTTVVDILRVSPSIPVAPLGRIVIPGFLDGFVPADVDQDGRDELVAWSPRYDDSGLLILRRLSGFSYETGPIERLPDVPRQVLPGNWLPDPGLELVVSGYQYLSLMARDAGGEWTIRHYLSDRQSGTLESISDMNGDGLSELKVHDRHQSFMSLYLSNPITGFGDPIQLPTGLRDSSPLVADITGDGQPDLLYSETDTTLAVRYGLPSVPSSPAFLTAEVDDWSVTLDWSVSNPLDGHIEFWRISVGATNEVAVLLEPIVPAVAAGRFTDSTLRTAGRYRYRLVHRDPDGYGQTLAARDVVVQPDPGPMRLLSTRAGSGPGQFLLSYEVRVPGPVQLEIFSVTGRRVRSHDLGTLAVSRGEVEWNGRGDDGRRVASGIYFARLKESTTTLRLVLLR